MSTGWKKTEPTIVHLDPTLARQYPSVYRVFDDASNLLYVGSTELRFPWRWKGHMERRSQWTAMASVAVVEAFRTLAEARNAEIAAIQTEDPLFNCIHNLSTERCLRLLGYLIERDQLDRLPFFVRRRLKIRNVHQITDELRALVA